MIVPFEKDIHNFSLEEKIVGVTKAAKEFRERYNRIETKFGKAKSNFKVKQFFELSKKSNELFNFIKHSQLYKKYSTFISKKSKLLTEEAKSQLCPSDRSTMGLDTVSVSSESNAVTQLEKEKQDLNLKLKNQRDYVNRLNEKIRTLTQQLGTPKKTPNGGVDSKQKGFEVNLRTQLPSYNYSLFFICFILTFHSHLNCII